MSATSSEEVNVSVMTSKALATPIESTKQVENASPGADSASENEGAQLSPSADLLGSPPLPEELPPPLPTETPPAEDDGWAPVWDDHAQAFYFFNRFTNASQWDNPRVPIVAPTAPPGIAQAAAPGTERYEEQESTELIKPVAPPSGGYDPAIHGDYDPTADYARVDESSHNGVSVEDGVASDPGQAYAATGTFNRFTGRWQAADLNPENFNDENKSRRQMNAFFDVDAAANSHDGKSLKAERSGKKLSKAEVKAFKDKRRERKEEKRRAWLRD